MRDRRRGFTLIEMLVVLVIFSLALGLAVTVFRSANQDLGVRAGANRVVSLLRGAQAQAHADGVPAQVVLDTQERSIYALTQETVGMWHFEDENGAFSQVAKLHKVIATVQGYLGGCYAFGASAWIDCGPIPVNSTSAGIVIDLYVRRPARVVARSASRRPLIICSLGADVVLQMETDGRLEGKVGTKRVMSGTEKLRLDEWEHVVLDYSTLDLKLFLNGREVGSSAGTTEWTATGATFAVGSQVEGFVGLIDEVRVSLVLPHDVYVLPSETSFDFPQSVTLRDRRYYVVWFDGEGRLDPRHHAAPVVFTIKSAADAKLIGVQFNGVVAR